MKLDEAARDIEVTPDLRPGPGYRPQGLTIDRDQAAQQHQQPAQPAQEYQSPPAPWSPAGNLQAAPPSPAQPTGNYFVDSLSGLTQSPGYQAGVAPPTPPRQPAPRRPGGASILDALDSYGQAPAATMPPGHEWRGMVGSPPGTPAPPVPHDIPGPGDERLFLPPVTTKKTWLSPAAKADQPLMQAALAAASTPVPPASPTLSDAPPDVRPQPGGRIPGTNFTLGDLMPWGQGASGPPTSPDAPPDGKSWFTSALDAVTQAGRQAAGLPPVAAPPAHVMRGTNGDETIDYQYSAQPSGGVRLSGARYADGRPAPNALAQALNDSTNVGVPANPGQAAWGRVSAGNGSLDDLRQLGLIGSTSFGYESPGQLFAGVDLLSRLRSMSAADKYRADELGLRRDDIASREKMTQADIASRERVAGMQFGPAGASRRMNEALFTQNIDKMPADQAAKLAAEQSAAYAAGQSGAAGPVSGGTSTPVSQADIFLRRFTGQQKFEREQLRELALELSRQPVAVRQQVADRLKQGALAASGVSTEKILRQLAELHAGSVMMAGPVDPSARGITLQGERSANPLKLVPEVLSNMAGGDWLPSFMGGYGGSNVYRSIRLPDGRVVPIDSPFSLPGAFSRTVAGPKRLSEEAQLQTVLPYLLQRLAEGG